MRKLFYPRLAMTNIRKNARFYLPYLLTAIGTVAMFYMMCAVSYNSGLKEMPGADALKSLLGLGIFVIALFAAIFLLYTNSFLMKRRQKEIGLYNVLGMGKRHIAKVLALETLYIALAALLIGILSGMLLDRLVMMLLYKLLQFSTPIVFELSSRGVIDCLLLFSGIFALNLLMNLARIRIANPIELLRGGQMGEKEPKSKWVLAVLGVLCLGTGYTIAIVVKTPLEALMLFFVAVILVIIGTYLLFTAGSIALLKLLRKNKNYYYRTGHFTTVSGMLYRMKQNAVGLANICVLSTMVLVMVSTTVCLYSGTEGALAYRYPYDISIGNEQTVSEQDRAALDRLLRDTTAQQGCPVTEMQDYTNLSVMFGLDGDTLTAESDVSADIAQSHAIQFITAADYQRLTGETLSLSDNEVLLYNDAQDVAPLHDRFSLLGTTYTVQRELDSFPTVNTYAGFVTNIHNVVVANDGVMKAIAEEQQAVHTGPAGVLTYRVNMNLAGTEQQKLEAYRALERSLSGTHLADSSESRAENRSDFYATYGGFLFLGVFLGLLFLMATVLIIYYKQISEGYDDKERFTIMQKVGMTRSEVKRSIRAQVLTVFFLPIAAAFVHVLAAFPMITRLLSLLNLTDVGLFFWCTVGTVLTFAAIYAAVYALTARAYYRIVES